MLYSQNIDDRSCRRPRSTSELARATPALDKIRKWKDDGTLPLLKLPARRDDLEALKPHAERFAKFEHVVVMGSGGSSMSGKTLNALKDQGFGPAKGRPTLHFMDNVDPARFAAMTSQLPLDKTGFMPISKSGGTPETLMATFTAIAAIEAKLGKAAVASNMIAITEPTDNPLRKLMTRYGATVLDHDPKIGGRYTIFSLVGALPGMIAGVDCAALREGAASVLDPVLAAKDTKDLAPAIGAALSVGLSKEKGINITVMMPYVDRLETFAFWYRQIWAESLGKNGNGTTPIRADGHDRPAQPGPALSRRPDRQAVHPGDRRTPTGRAPSSTPAMLGGDKALDYLSGQTMGDLLQAEADAIAATLAKNGRPVRSSVFPLWMKG